MANQALSLGRKPYSGAYFRRINTRRHALIDALYLRGLTRCEWFEYAAIEAQLDRDDAAYYGPMIARLEKMLADREVSLCP